MNEPADAVSEATPTPLPVRPTNWMILGACAALALALLPDALLLPAVDRTPPRALALTVSALALGAGWWLAGLRRRSVDGPLLLLLGVGCLVGGGLGLWLVGPAGEALRERLVTGSRVPYPALVSLAMAAVAVPVLLPLGALLGFSLGHGGRKPLAAALAGAGAALVVAPLLGEQLVGRHAAVGAASVLAAAVSVALAQRTPWVSAEPGLRPGAALALAVLGAVAAVADHLLTPLVDLGTTASCWFAAGLCLAAAVGALLPALPSSLLDPAVAVAAVWVLVADPLVRADETLPLGTSLARLALAAVPLGLAAGLLLSRRGRGPGPWVVPVAGLLVVPAVSWRLLPYLGVAELLGLLAAVLALGALLVPPRPSLLRWVVVVALTVGVAWLPLPGERVGRPAELPLQLADGRASWVVDPQDGRNRVAVDGWAPLGRSLLQEHRLVHVPFALHGDAQRVLVVATDAGAAEAAALEHDPRELDWLRPFPVPGVRSLDPEPPGRRRPQGNERLFLAGVGEPYDLIVLLPDPRVHRRGRLLATREFYEQVGRCLKPGGLLVQWWDPSRVGVETLRHALASADAALRDVTLLTDHPRSRLPLVGLVAGHRELRVRTADVRRHLADHPPVKREFEQVGLDPLLVSCLVGPAPGMAPLLATPPPHATLTDDRPVLGSRTGFADGDARTRLLEGAALVDDVAADPMLWTSVPPHLRGIATGQTRAIRAAWAELVAGARAVLDEQGLAARPFETEGLGGFPEVEAPYLLAALEHAPDWTYLEQLVLARADWFVATGRTQLAVDWLLAALERDHRSTPYRMTLAALLEIDGATSEAAALYRAVLALAPNHGEARDALVRLGETGL